MRFKRSLLLGAVGSLVLAIALPGAAALASVRASSAKPAIVIGCGELRGIDHRRQHLVRRPDQSRVQGDG